MVMVALVKTKIDVTNLNDGMSGWLIENRPEHYKRKIGKTGRRLPVFTA